MEDGHVEGEGSTGGRDAPALPEAVMQPHTDILVAGKDLAAMASWDTSETNQF